MDSSRSKHRHRICRNGKSPRSRPIDQPGNQLEVASDRPSKDENWHGAVSHHASFRFAKNTATKTYVVRLANRGLIPGTKILEGVTVE